VLLRERARVQTRDGNEKEWDDFFGAKTPHFGLSYLPDRSRCTGLLMTSYIKLLCRTVRNTPQRRL
jgi:hypothetical protein